MPALTPTVVSNGSGGDAMWRRGWIGRMLVMAAITVGAALLPAHEAHAMRVRHATLAASMRWESAAIPASFQTIVQQQAVRIWARLGVEIEWTSAVPAAALTVIVADRLGCVPSHAVDQTLGCITFIEGMPSNVVYVSAEVAVAKVREARPADRSMYDVPRKLVDTVAARLLGRGVAHEIGHYLLASRSHTTRGLMRPQFSGVEALISDVTRYELDRGQRRRLEERLGEEK